MKGMAGPVGEDSHGNGTTRLLSWMLLGGFLFITGAARAVYSSHGELPSSRFELLANYGTLAFLWYWFSQEFRGHRATFPLDMGLFLGVLWFVLIPYYLWRYERWRGLAKLLLLGVLHFGAWAFSYAMHYGLVWLDALGWPQGGEVNWVTAA